MPTVLTQTANAPAAQPPSAVLDRLWAPAILASGVGLTAAWIFFLGYGLIELVVLAF